MKNDNSHFPWIKWYSDDQGFDLKETLYNTFVLRAQNRLDKVALFINETGDKYTYQDILNLADVAAGGFSRLGITVGSKIGILLNGTVEEAVSLLALNKLGAISKFVDYMKSPAAIKHIHDCATIVPKVGGSIEEIVAFVQADYADLDTFLKVLRDSNILSEFEMPTKFIMTESIPYTRNGKVDYRFLEQMDANQLDSI